MAELVFSTSRRIYNPLPDETTQRNIFFQAFAATVALAGIAVAGAVYSKRCRPLISHTITYALGGAVSLLSLCLLQFFRGVNAFMNKNGDRPLHLAVEKNDARKVNFLLFIGANPNAQNSNDYTPLHVSCNSVDQTQAQVSITKGLIEYGADVNAPSRLLETPLHRIVLNLRDHNKKADKAAVNLQQIKILIQYGAKNVEAIMD